MNAVTPPSPYAFPERALQRWARENLTLTARADGRTEAIFRFEGSTCSNIAFQLIYQITLGPRTDERRIESLCCVPAPHYEGHTRMCCWQENAAAVIKTMSTETPLLGQPLAAVLTWRPIKSPAGCLCAAPSRHHKWQAALETLHFALHPLPTPPL